MNIEIISPEKLIYAGEAEAVSLPGLLGSFTVLDHHAPIISVLQAGQLVYKVGGGATELAISSGFVEVKDNKVSICVE